MENLATESAAVIFEDNTAIVYDTETTGLPDFKARSYLPHQPHLVQLGAVVVDLTTREVLQTLDVMIRPDGWEIPDEVAKIHGITTEKAAALGVPEALALEMFLQLWDRAGGGRTRIAHNEQFDARIIRIACARYQPDIADHWKAGTAKCTAKLSSPIVNLPPTEAMRATGRNFPKTPKLSEAYEHFMGKPLVGAHNAMVDVLACRDVYFAMNEIGHV